MRDADALIVEAASSGSALLRDTIESLREGVQILSPDWRYLYLNQAAAAHGRKPKEELLGRTLLECYPDIQHTAVFRELDRCMGESRVSELENEFEFEDGTRRWFELRIYPCREGLCVLSLDITKRKDLEVALRQSHQLRVLGELSAGIAHDLNNLLSPVAGELAVLEQQVEGQEEVAQTMELIRSALKAATQTVELLQEFGRQTPESTLPEPMIVNETVRYARRLYADRIRRCDVQESLNATAPVRVKPAELLSALLNLIANAIDAMPDGGRLTLATGSTDAEVWVEVSDTGVGMSPDVQERAVEPYFTTKNDRGSGLGLAMVNAFVSRSGGKLALRSEIRAGTSVRLSFPHGLTSA